MPVCITPDDFLTEKLHWIITLSNGETIYQDDGRPGEDPPQAWFRLLQYLKETGVFIESIKLKFCSHVELISPKEFVGVFFVQSIERFIQSKRNLNYYIFGFAQQNTIDELFCTHWLVPEILAIRHEVRPTPFGDEKFWLKNAVN